MADAAAAAGLARRSPGSAWPLREAAVRCPARRLLLRGSVVVALVQASAAAQGQASVASRSRRLHIRNGCSREPIWIAHMAGAGEGVDPQNIKIEPGGVYHFQTPPNLTATRYWPKMGCNEQGANCTMGSSGGPGQTCTECAPPVDTKFEGTFNVSGWDFVDMSLVDGWTLPFAFNLSGGVCHGQEGANKSLYMDCSTLGIENCPAEEELTAANLTADLRVWNPHREQIVGCYSPCAKLTFSNWNNDVAEGRSFDDPEVSPYCCPTPPETPKHCRAGPIVSTSFLEAVHLQCPGVYGFAYDDGMGLLQCTPTTDYEVTFFCPDGQDRASRGGGSVTGQADAAISEQPRQYASSSSHNSRGFIGAGKPEAIVVGGVADTAFVGFEGHGGWATGDNLSITHGSVATLQLLVGTSRWEPQPANVLPLYLLGRALRFTVDLHRAGCGCNVAVYLASAASGLADGHRMLRSKRSDLCLRPKAKGQNCSEVAIMEANNAVFQASPHRCITQDSHGNSTSCDESGCARYAQGNSTTYGPGPDFFINTVQPFEVHTEFVVNSGALADVVTSLRQAGRTATLTSSRCSAAYLAKLGETLKAGASLRIAYWGEGAGDTAWLDARRCGEQHCTAEGAKAAATFSEVAVVGPVAARRQELPAVEPTPKVAARRQELPAVESTPKAETTAQPHNEDVDKFVWVVSDPEDALFERVLPQNIVNHSDNGFFVQTGSHGLARWQKAMHLVQRVARPTDLPSGCETGQTASSCKVQMKNRRPTWANMVTAKYGVYIISSSSSSTGSVAPALLAAAVPAALTFAWLRKRRACCRGAAYDGIFSEEQEAPLQQSSGSTRLIEALIF